MLHEGAPNYDGRGFLTSGDAPGLGVALRHDAVERFPRRRRNLNSRLHVDGSVVDQ
jgi:galactonate dehydratase